MATQTKLSNLINPQVMGEYLDVKLTDAIKLYPLLETNLELSGKPGDTLSIPKFAYIGDALDVAEGVAIDTVPLTATSIDVKVKKAGKAIEITDEAMLNSYGNTENESVKQLLLSISNKIESDAFESLRTATLKHTLTSTKLSKEDIADALVKFGEDIYDTMFIFVNPTEYSELRQDSSFIVATGGDVIIKGHMGSIYGCNLVVTNRVKPKEAFIMKPGAVGLLMKRNVLVESDRDILKKTTVISADEHFVTYLRDDSKAIKIELA